MGMEPEFWTRIIIFVDSSEFSLSSISSHLSYSRQLPIDIRVTKKTPHLLPTSEAHENLRLQKITDIIKPYTHRCHSLRYEVTYTSSLPQISTHLQGTFPFLTDLRLEASKASETIRIPPAIEWDIQCPSLVCLVVDGLNFIDISKNARVLLDKPQRKYEPFARIAVSHLRQPTCDAQKFSLSDIFLHISKAYTLQFEDLDVDWDVDATYDVLDFPSPILTLVDLNSGITFAILSSYEYTSSLEIIRCHLNMLACIPYAEFLTLDGIDDSESLAILLPEWDGHNLVMRNCPGFDDSVLKAIGTCGYPTPSLCDLSIVNCFNFSTAVLRDTVEHCITNNHNNGGIISVSGRNVPAMTAQEKEWFVAEDIYLHWGE